MSNPSIFQAQPQDPGFLIQIVKGLYRAGPVEWTGVVESLKNSEVLLYLKGKWMLSKAGLIP